MNKLVNNILVITIFVIFVFIIGLASTFKSNFIPNSQKVKKAICVLTNTTENVKGVITLEENGNICKIHIKASGLSLGKHGFHIHNKGDLTDGCTSLCSHFNPYNKHHGGRNSKERHVGDLGNITADVNGNVDETMYNKTIKLNGPLSVIGRSFIIHADEDDLGLYNGPDPKKREESLKTGNAGKRQSCGVIGIA